MTSAAKIIALCATALTALVVTLVLTTGGKNHSPEPAGLVSQVNCSSQVGVDPAQRAFRLCLFTPRLSPPGPTSPDAPVHWGVVTSVGA